VKRAAILASVLTLAAIAASRGQDNSFRVKVAMVNSQQKRMEGKFVVMPDDLRIVCAGDPSGMSVGDYVKVEFKNGKPVIRKMVCDQIAWYH
jgi:hypothetical protein